MKSIKAQFNQSYWAWYKSCFINLGKVLFDGSNYRQIGETLKIIAMFILIMVFFITFPITGFLVAWYARKTFKAEYKDLVQNTKQPGEKES